MAGLAFIPSPLNTFSNKTQGGQTTYTYSAGNWNTAFFTGIGVEFGKGKQQPFLVNVQYLKGIGNLGNNELVTVSGSKTTHTTFSSKTSGWSITAGFPISLSKQQQQKQKASHHKEYYKTEYKKEKKSCEQIKLRCRTIN